MTKTHGVKDWGWVGDGSADDGPALQRALDGRGVVEVPPGTYRVGRTLRIGSGTRLRLHPQATLVFADGAGVDADSFLLTNADHESGNREIEVRGGIWNGNNRHNARDIRIVADAGAYTGVLVHFRNVKGLVFGDALLTDAESYHFRATQIEQFLVENIAFHSTHPRPNNDGIHLGGNCQNGTIRHLRGLGPYAPNDDMVALNADDALTRTECQGKRCGPITDVVVHDLEAHQCHSFVRILSTDSPIERVDVSRLRGGCTASCINMDGARGCRVPVFDADDPKYDQGVGLCRDLRIADAAVWSASVGAREALLRIQQRVHGLEILNFRRDPARDGSPQAPTIDARYLPAHTLDLESFDPDLDRAAGTPPRRRVERADLGMADHFVSGVTAFERCVVHETG